jgi:hypothetical protein
MGVDTWRIALSVIECGVVQKLPSPTAVNEVASFTPAPAGIVDIHPVRPLDAYEFATIGKTFAALQTSLHDDYVQLGEQKTGHTCNGASATARAAVWTDTENAVPTFTDLTLKELSNMGIEGNGWRVTVVVTSDEQPTYVAPALPPLDFTFPAELLPKS